MPEATRRIHRRYTSVRYSSYLHYTRRALSLLAAASMVVMAGGCARQRIFDIAHFSPVPRDSVNHTSELAPVEPSGEPVGGHAYSPLVVPDPLPERVKAEIAELQESYRPTFQRGLNRASKYEVELRSELRKAGLPEDLVHLAMVESMYQEKVVSPAGAGGMWQFIPATARRYQQRIDGYVDARYDWRCNTQAAIQYLKDLHDYFDGSWELAVTAYNMGEGGLGRIIDATGGERNFWKLVETPPACDRIRLESKKYYPRLLAYIIVTRDLEKYGFTRGTEPPDQVMHVPVPGMYSLARLDETMGYPPGTLARLNPELVREVTPPTGDWEVAVPAPDREKFLACLPNVPVLKSAPSPLRLASGSSVIEHKVKRGESLAKIARKYGSSEKAILVANKMKSAKSLAANRVLLVPVDNAGRGGSERSAETDSAAKVQPKDKLVEAASKVEMQTYTVKKGDSLAKIAKTLNTSPAKLQELNPALGKKGMVFAGQVLNTGAGPAAPPAENKRYHVVKPGEYPAVIARMYDLSTTELLRINELDASDTIHVGDKLLVAANPAAPAVETRIEQVAEKTVKGEEKASKKPRITSVTHQVAKGETAASIATKYGVSLKDLLAKNKLTSKSVLHVGQEIVVEQAGAGEKAADNAQAAPAKAEVKMAKADTGEPPKGEKIIHTVAKGQNPSVIANKYHVPVNALFSWNGWAKAPVLKVGDAVTVYKK